jgi:hypothetical protein
MQLSLWCSLVEVWELQALCKAQQALLLLGWDEHTN